MVIDAYNNAWEGQDATDYLTGEALSVTDMLALMDEAEVDRAVITTVGQKIDNGFIARLVAEHPDRLIGFGQVNARDPRAAAVVDECAERHGLQGLKLHPTLHGYHFADHALLDPVFAACRRHGLIVVINALDDPFCGPFAIEEIARGFPEVPVLIAHMGSVWNQPEAVIVAARNPHIYLETSCATMIETRWAYEKAGPEKVVMGADWPANDFALEREKIRRAVRDEADRELIEGGNMARLLGLELPAAGTLEPRHA